MAFPKLIPEALEELEGEGPRWFGQFLAAVQGEVMAACMHEGPSDVNDSGKVTL